MRAPRQSSALKLGISSGVPASRLPVLLARQRAEEPETPISLEEVTSSAGLIKHISDGLYDVGLVATTSITDEAPLWRDELAIALSDRSPLLRYTAIPATALLSYPLFQYCPLACDVLFGPKWPVPCQATSYELMTVLVSAGYGVGIAPRSRIEQSRNSGVVMRPLAERAYWIETHVLRSQHGDQLAMERFIRRAQTAA